MSHVVYYTFDMHEDRFYARFRQVDENEAIVTEGSTGYRTTVQAIMDILNSDILQNNRRIKAVVELEKSVFDEKVKVPI